MHFLIVNLANGVSLDYYETGKLPPAQHYAFLVTEAEFDAVFQRLRDRGCEYWADPARTQSGTINRHFRGRGVYFHDPDQHLLELITRPYGRESELSGPSA